jgi:hypothetical protein
MLVDTKIIIIIIKTKNGSQNTTFTHNSSSSSSRLSNSCNTSSPNDQLAKIVQHYGVIPSSSSTYFQRYNILKQWILLRLMLHY